VKFLPTPLAGAFVVEPEPISDARGMFARTYCEQEFAAHGVPFRTVQCNTSFNLRRDTLRGMHFQEGSAAEERLVRCTSGEIHDVIVDLRPDSKTRLQWFAAALSAGNRRMLFIPKGFAHGFKTLTDGCEVFYQMSSAYDAAAARGVRWNDPAFGIRWPGGTPILSERDRSYPDFSPDLPL
jgi:dTDP-4-dehydrorhamnose 3,5-epimerase